MKQLLKFVLFVVLCGLSAPAFSAMTLGGTYSSTDSQFSGGIIITETGCLKGVRSLFSGEIINHGKMNLDRCAMKAEITSHGTIEANATEFSKDVTICAGETTLNSCKLLNLNILDNDHENKPIKITLKGATKIDGKIVFETGQGEVYKGPNVVIKGEIIGGKLIKIKE